MATYLIDCLRHSPLVLLMEKSDAHSVKIRVDKGLWQVSTLVPDHVQPQILNLNHKKITYFRLPRTKIPDDTKSIECPPAPTLSNLNTALAASISGVLHCHHHFISSRVQTIHS